MRRYADSSPLLGLLISSTLAVVSTSAAGNEKNYLLLPVTTQLQRLLLSPTTSAYCVVNANALIRDGNVDPTGIGLAKFRAELAAVAKQNAGNISIHCRFQNWQQQPTAEKQLEAALAQYCREAGFQRVAAGKIYTSDAWQQQLDTFEKPLAEDVEGDEAASEDENVRVFPVKTRLSQVLAGNVDCVAFLRRPIDGRMVDLPEDIALSIRHCLNEVRLAGRRVINLRLTSTKAGESVVEEFINSNGNRLSQADQFAKSLGFEFCTVSHSHGGGAPETLLGKPAPDFSLEGLDKRTIRFQDHIRGKAALLTFWGVACGPCRVEAPHLSTLFEKYKSNDFTLLAVNSYNEGTETVAEFVQKQSLHYPIALQGREVARQKYAVGAYPTTFWIDRDGFVIDYIVGFDPGDEIQLAATVERLLKPPSQESP